MAAACLLACVGMVTGFFLILGLKPAEFSDGLSAFLLREPGTLRSEVNRLAGFGWVEDKGGGAVGETAPDMYENGNKIGSMG